LLTKGGTTHNRRKNMPAATAAQLRQIFNWFFGFKDALKGDNARAALKAKADASTADLNSFLVENVEPKLPAGFALSERQCLGIRKALDDLNFEPLNPYPEGGDAW
jgi:hypothetical protein